MAITREQLIDLGFKPTKLAKGKTRRKYDSLVLYINDTDYLFTGFNNITRKIDFKRIWKSFEGPEGRISYAISHTGHISYTALKEYIESAKELQKIKDDIEKFQKNYG